MFSQWDGPESIHTNFEAIPRYEKKVTEVGFEPVTWRKKFTRSSYSSIRLAYKRLLSLFVYLVVMGVFGGKPPRVTSSDPLQKNSVLYGNLNGCPCRKSAQSIRWFSRILIISNYWRRVTKKRKKLKACHFVIYAGTSGSLTLRGQVSRPAKRSLRSRARSIIFE